MKEWFTDSTAATCHTGTGVADMTTKLSDCLSTSEKNHNVDIANVLTLKDAIDDAKNHIIDGLTRGDSIFGTSGHSQVTREMKHHNDELKLKKSSMEKAAEKKQQIIQTHNRDFSDHLEPANESKVMSVEDYTVFMFVMSYVFAACIFIYVYTYNAPVMLQGLGKSVGIIASVSIVGGMLFYNIV
jgi:hypothetical protein